MSPLHPSVAFVVLLAIVPGCAENPKEEERKLIPVMTESGRVSYRFEDEMTEPDPAAQSSSGFIPAQQPRLVAGNQRGDDPVFREVMEHRRRLHEQINQSLAERRAEQAAQDLLDGQRRFQREQNRVEQQVRWQREHEGSIQRRQDMDRAAQDQAARDQRQLEVQVRLREQQTSRDFQQLMLEQQRQSRP